MSHFNALDFSECQSEKVMFLLMLSVFISSYTSNKLKSWLDKVQAFILNVSQKLTTCKHSSRTQDSLLVAHLNKKMFCSRMGSCPIHLICFTFQFQVPVSIALIWDKMLRGLHTGKPGLFRASL